MLTLPAKSELSVVIIYVLLFIQGLTVFSRGGLSISYFCEFWPQRYHSTVSTVYNIVEATVFLFLTLFYRFVSINWKYTFAFGCLEHIVGILLNYFYVPESPKWLYNEERYQECSIILNKMAKFNGINSTPLADKIKNLSTMDATSNSVDL